MGTCGTHSRVLLLFRRVGWDSETYSEWSQRLAREGVILCLPTTWRGETVLRLAFVKPATKAERVFAVLETLRQPSIPQT